MRNITFYREVSLTTENKFKGQFLKNLTPLCNKVRVLRCFEWAKGCNDLQPLEHPTIKKYELDYDYCCFSYAELRSYATKYKVHFKLALKIKHGRFFLYFYSIME